MSFVVRRKENETWRECVERTAKPYGLEEQCLEDFDYWTTRGVAEGRAAWKALAYWVLGC